MLSPSARAPHATRRGLLLAGAAACLPLAARATIFTPHELAVEYARRVSPRIDFPREELPLYGGMLEMQLWSDQQRLMQPQYLLVVDRNPNVQAAFLFWRLVAGQLTLIGASPVSTGGPGRTGRFETPAGVFGQQSFQSKPRAGRIFDFGLRMTREAGGSGPLRPARLQLQPAQDGDAIHRLGSAQSDGSIVAPASLLSFLDEFAVLDGERATPAARNRELPYRGRYLVVIDSEREDRPRWAVGPHRQERFATNVRMS